MRGMMWVLCLCVLAAPVCAGLRLPDRRVVPGQSQVVELRVVTQMARTAISQRFENHGAAPIEGSYTFPLPKGAIVQEFATVRGGVRRVAALMEKDLAHQRYERLAAGGYQPALAEKSDGDAFTVQVDPILPGEAATLELIYEEVLPYRDGKISYRYPLDGQTSDGLPLAGFSFHAEITDARGIATAVCPSHPADVQARAGRWTADLAQEALAARGELALEYALPRDATTTAFLGGTGADGQEHYLLALISPREGARVDEVAAKDVELVVDISGSMAGQKLLQAKQAFAACIEQLNPQDRFNVIAFDDRVDRMWAARRTATPENRAAALRWVNALSERGSTNLWGAITSALADLEVSEGARYIYLLTDGEPTAGLTDPDAIARAMHEANRRAARLYAFGVGRDVNRHLLDRLALEHRGEAIYMENEIEVRDRILALFAKNGRPLAVDPSLSFEGIPVADVYPETLPDLYLGTQVPVVCRVIGEPQPGAAMVLSCRLGAKRDAQRFPIPADYREQGFHAVPRVWASAKVEALMRRIRRGDPDAGALKAEVIATGAKFKILTEYTSFLTAAPVDVPPDPAASNGIRCQVHGTSDAPVQEEAPYTPQFHGGIFGLVTPNFKAARERSGTRACYANQKTIVGAIEMYNLDKNTKRTDLTPQFFETLKSGGYLQSIPQDPGQGPGSSANYTLTHTDNGITCRVHGGIQSGGGRPVVLVRPWWHTALDVLIGLAELFLVLLQLWIICRVIGGTVRGGAALVRAVGRLF